MNLLKTAGTVLGAIVALAATAAVSGPAHPARAAGTERAAGSTIDRIQPAQKTLARRPDPTRVLRGHVGMNTHFYMSSNMTNMVTQDKNLRRGGVSIIRDAFKWDQIQPKAGEWKWQRTDAMMTAASIAKLNVLAIVAYSAPWA